MAILEVFFRGRSGCVAWQDCVVVTSLPAELGVPRVVAVVPWQPCSQAVEDVKKGPGDDDVVVKRHVESDEDGAVTHSYGVWIYSYAK